jgi:hypothetical protein
MLEYLTKVQQNDKKRNSSFLITIPKVLSNILEISKGSTISFSLAKSNNENVIVLKKVKEVKTEPEYRVNVVM